MKPLSMLEVATFPEHIQSAVEEQRWDDLVAALDNGVAATLYSRREGQSLLAFVLLYHEAGQDKGVPSIPLKVLDAFCGHGLSSTTLVDGVGAVALAGQYGQWAWAHHLLNQGWPVEPAGQEKSALSLVISGHWARQRLSTFKTIGDALLQGANIFEEFFPSSPTSDELPENVHALPVSPVLDVSEENAKRAIKRFFEAVDTTLADRVSTFSFEKRGMLSLCLRLLERGAKQDSQTLFQVRDEQRLLTPLEQVIALRETELAAAWLDSPHVTTGFPRGALAMASEGNDLATLKALLDRTPPDLLQEEGRLAVLGSVRCGHRLPLDLLQAAGVNLNVHDDRGWTLAQCAAEKGSRPLLAYLTRQGVDLEAAVEDGPTAADLLRMNYPFLLEVFGLKMPEETANVRVLRRPRP